MPRPTPLRYALSLTLSDGGLLSLLLSFTLSLTLSLTLPLTLSLTLSLTLIPHPIPHPEQAADFNVDLAQRHDAEFLPYGTLYQNKADYTAAK